MLGTSKAPLVFRGLLLPILFEAFPQASLVWDIEREGIHFDLPPIRVGTRVTLATGLELQVSWGAVLRTCLFSGAVLLLPEINYEFRGEWIRKRLELGPT
jgi:hypothetical protein